MFWDKNDSPSQNIEALLEKENVTVEEFLDEDDIIQECKTQKKSIVNYFTRPDVIKRMIELITTEPPEDLPMAQRFRHANVACEILLLGLPSLDEKLISNEETLKMLYSYLENEPPLNPLLASFFSKTFSMLFTKKSDQDWFLYQQLCLKLLEYLKTQNNFLDLICKHFSTPVIPDLIMEMMRNVEGGQLRRSLYEWLNEERLVEKLIDIIGDPEQSEKHANVAEFLCDLIQQGRTMRQTDQENDSFEPIFEGSNPILKNIESAPTLFALFNVILQPNALESAIVSGITVVLKIIKPVMVIDERISDRLKFLQDREKEIHNELLSTVIRVIEPQLKHFNELLRNPPKKPDIVISAAVLSPPFGMTRLQICRLFTVLLQTNNEEILKAICETDFFDSLLSLFKEYCWNNFLHSEVEKCLHTVFYSSLANNTNNNSTYVSNGSQNKQLNFLDNVFDNKFTDLGASDQAAKKQATPTQDGKKSNDETAAQSDLSKESNEADVTKVPAEILPSAIQTHLIVNCNVVSRLIECWQINKEIESAEKGRRLGYMGHLIKIFKHITNCISESEHIGALIDSNLKDDAERESWQSIVNSTDGELTQALKTQSKLLANCEACDYDISLDFLTDNDFSGAFNTLCAITDSMDTFGRSNDDDEDDDEENAAAGDVLSFDANPLSRLESFTVTRNPWDTNDDFDVFKSASSSMTWAPEGGTSDNFADFDAHFSSFTNDMGESLTTATSGNDNIGDFSTPRPQENVSSMFPNASNTLTAAAATATTCEEYDNNANVGKLSWPGELSAFHSRQNFVDDYEDDDGMWTKPLGASAFNATENSQEAEETNNSETDDVVQSAFTNGPTTKCAEGDNKVNNLDNSQISQENASINSVNEDESHENEQNAINDEQELINKHKSSITTIEADTSTTADHLKDNNTLSPVTDEEAVGTTTIMATTQDSTT